MTTTEALPPAVRALYPWQGERLPVTGGASLHYLDVGEGEPLVMVHGNPTWSFYYRTLVHGLSDDYRCVVPDHVGCGLSDKPADYPYTLATHVDNLVRLVESLDLRDITMVVHDWGGPIGIGAALRLRDRIKRLVVFNTAVFRVTFPRSIRMCRVPGLGPLLIQGMNGFVRVGMFRAIADRGRLSGPVGQGYLAPYDTWANRRAQMAFINDIPWSADHPTAALLDEIDAGLAAFSDTPALVIWGEQDFCFTPAYREVWQRRLPHAEVHALDDAAHWVVEDAHERIVPLIRDFLERHP